MPSTFVNNLRGVLRTLAERDPKKLLQSFTKRRADVSTLKAFYDSTPGFFTEAEINALENTRNSSQTVTISKYNKIAAGTGAQRKRIGVGGSTEANIVPNFFAPIVEEFDNSFVQQATRQYLSEGAEKGAAIRQAMQNDLAELGMEKITNMYERANTQMVNYLEAEKWALATTGDAGTVYTTLTNDKKNVPAGDLANKEFFQKLKVEIRDNNFNRLSGREPLIIGSTRMEFLIDKYSESGSQQAINVNQFAGFFKPYVDNAIVDAVGDQVTMYLIPYGGVGAFSRAFPWDAHPDAQNGVVTKGNDSWYNMNVGSGSGLFDGVPNVRIEVKEYGGYTDNFATYAIDEARIDISQGWVFTAQFGAEHAVDQVSADISPIIKYAIAN